jgi:signal transduction histidine kinase/PAS domain-containing protein
MNKKPHSDSVATKLRRRAEDRLREPQRNHESEPGDQRLLQELQIHQIELEMQNEELTQSRADAEANLAHYSELYDFAPAGYFTLNHDSKILQANLFGAHMLGINRDKLVNRRFSLLVSESDRSVFNDFLIKVFEGREEESCEIALRNDVNRLPLSQRTESKHFGRPRKRSIQIKGAIGKEERVCRTVAIDITDRKMIEDAQLFLSQSGWSGGDFFQSLARYLAETLEMDFVCIDRLEGDNLSAQTLAIYHDGHFEENVAYVLRDTPCGDVVGKTICCFPKNVRHLFPKDAVLQDLRAESYVGTTLWSSNGKPIGLIAMISCESKEDLRIPGLILKLAAIRAAGELERRQIDEVLKKSKDELEDRVRERTSELQNRTEQLRALAFELTQAEIRVRKHLASVLHDDLQQLLVCAKFAASYAVKNTEKVNVHNSLKQIEDFLDQSIDKSRTLVTELSPPILSNGSLVDILQWLARWMHEKQGLAVKLHIEKDVETAPDIRSLLFLTVRELLFNIVKHAKVNHATVRVDRSDDGFLSIIVTDKGKGFDSNLVNKQGGVAFNFGLFSIQERLQCIGGRFEIVSAPGRGTAVKLFAPTGRESHDGIATTTSSHQAPMIHPSSTPFPPISVLLVDDHRTFREGVAHLLREVDDIQVIGEAQDGQQAVDMVQRLHPNVVIMDVNMPGMNGIDATRIITSECPQCRTIALSMYSEVEIETAMRKAGAVNYLIKTGPSGALIDAIRSCVHPGT